MSGGNREEAVAELMRDLSFAAALRIAPKSVVDVVASVLKRVITKRAISEAIDNFSALLGRHTNEKAAGNDDDLSYVVLDGRLCRMEWKKIIEDGEAQMARVPEPLANFQAQITEEIEVDMGEIEPERRFRIEGSLADGTVLMPIEVPAGEFGRMAWPEIRWGARAAPVAGQGRRDQLREGLQLLSTPKRRRAFGHLGWRSVDGRWIYLHAGGAVGADEVEVCLRSPLDRFTLPNSVEDARGAAALSLQILKCGPLEITAPVYAAIYLAPLATLVGVNVAVFLRAGTGQMKSVLSALAQAHHGNFDFKSLPASWEGTANAIEKLLYLAKDSLFVVDDYAPKSSDQAQKVMEASMQRIARSVGNHSGRSRMSRDLTLRPDYPPRAMVLTSGEDVPPGASILARLFVVEVERAQLNLPLITKLQNEASRLPHALRAYVESLAPHIDELRTELPLMLTQFRTRAFESNLGHARAPDNVAQLALGVKAGLEFARDVGALEAGHQCDLEEKCWAALLSTARGQASWQRETDPAKIFITTAATLVVQGRIYMRPKPAGSETKPRLVSPQAAAFVGWEDAEYVYFVPGAVREEVFKALNTTREGFRWSPQSLHQALFKGGYFAPGIPGRDGRFDQKVRFGSEGYHRVLKIRRTKLEEGPNDAENGATSGSSDSLAVSDTSVGVAPAAPDLER